MSKTLSAVLGIALAAGCTGAWAQSQDSDLEQRLKDYENRLQQLEDQQQQSVANGAGSNSLFDRVDVNGFITAGMLRSDVHTKKHGTEDTFYVDGATDRWSHQALTRGGIQFNARVSDKTRAVVQFYADGENNFDTELQWAYISQQITPDIQVRAGRIVAPFYMHSQYIDVGYAYPWVVLPTEVYRTVDIKTLEGIDANWRFASGPVSYTLGAFWGSTNISNDFRGRSNSLRADDLAGINFTTQWNNWTVRLAYSGAKTTIDPLPDDIEQLNELVGGVMSFEDAYTYFANAGIQYDNGQWYFAAEKARLEYTSWYPGRDSGYVSLGRRFGKWMPVLTWAELKTTDSSDSYFTEFDQVLAMNPGLAAMGFPSSAEFQNKMQMRQKSWTLGVRYSLNSSVDLKAEASHYYDFSGDGFDTSGLFVGPIENDRANIVRLSVDVVF